MGGEGGPKSKIATHPLPPDAEQWRRPGSAAAANPAAPGLGGGRDRGEKGERVAGDRSPASPLAGVLRRGGSAGAGGNGRSGSRRRRCCGSRGGGGGWAGSGGGGVTPGALYSRGEAVARPGVGDGRRAARSAINGVLAS